MAGDDQQQGAAPEAGAAGGDSVAVTRLPAPPNARVDGLDARAASFAAFLAREAEMPADAPVRGQAVQILSGARARNARHRQVRQTASVALGSLAVAGLVVWTMTSRPPAPARAPSLATLSYTVDGAAPPPDGYVRSSATYEPRLAFSDGTNIQMMPKARVRVLEVGSRGARVALEDGRAHVHVAHRPGADWQVQAGAFLIHVHGTAFFVAWNAAEARFDLQMESGVVSVDGPGSSDSVMLRAGQSLSVRPDGSRVFSSTQPGPAARVNAAPAPGSMPGPVEAPALEPSPGTPRPLPSAGQTHAPWSERLADGDAAGILNEAHRRGVANVLSGASSEDLAALADAARFKMQDGLARRVLLTQRTRFPGTLRAKEASFLLGRLADGQGGPASDALAWYQRYLHEAPSGAYAAEAMGRMMIALERQQRTDEARAVATAYLRRFPQGVYARAAREVTSPR